MYEESEKLPSIDLRKSQYEWISPTKRIHSSTDVQYFHTSTTIARLKEFLIMICEKVSLKTVPRGALKEQFVDFEPVKSTSLDTLSPPEHSFEDDLSAPVRAVLDILFFLDRLIDDTPPFKGPRRYGNMACRDWHDKVDSQTIKVLIEKLRPFSTANEEEFEGFIKEESYYLLNAFGSKQRLDYGTGHELSFLAFLAGLVMVGILNRDQLTGNDYLVIFSIYYDIVKKLILTYTLEPAGSHGVWGLDDHFHLIYILGAAQLVDFGSVESGEPPTDYVVNFRMGLTPLSIFNASALSTMRLKNLYFNAVAFIRKVKNGPFREHSPLLSDLASTKSWEKISKGMIKMYYGEVLSKYPVVQHFYFGNVLFPWTDYASGRHLPESTPDVNMQDAELTMATQTKNKLSHIKQDKERHILPSDQSRLTHTMGNNGRHSNSTLMHVRDRSATPPVVTKAPWAT